MFLTTLELPAFLIPLTSIRSSEIPLCHGLITTDLRSGLLRLYRARRLVLINGLEVSPLNVIMRPKVGVPEHVRSYTLSNCFQVFFNKSTNAMPYISEQYRTNTFLNKIRSSIIQVPVVETHGRKIDLAPLPKNIEKNGVVSFEDNGRPEAEVMKKVTCKPDVVILATGYTQKFSFLDTTYPTPQEATMRSVWKENDNTVGFIGFVRPSFGKWHLISGDVPRD